LKIGYIWFATLVQNKSIGNGLLKRKGKPWENNPGKEAKTIVSTGMKQIFVSAVLSWPIYKTRISGL
jgi:hypothetical protein